jgi:hypothetical protein
MPTDRWEDPTTGEQTGDPLWHLKYHEVVDALDSLERTFRIADAEMFRSVHIAPSILLRFGEGWQSGRSVDNIVQVLYDASMLDVKEVDLFLNILAARIDRWNYPSDSPPCRVKAVGLSSKDQEAIRNLAVVLANRPGGGGLDDVIDGPRFWEELGVPVREEGYPRIIVPDPEETEGELDVHVHEGAGIVLEVEEPEPGDKIVEKYDEFPKAIADDMRALGDFLVELQVNLAEEKAKAVEDITDEEWDDAEATLLSASRLLLYTPADLRALEAQMTPVQRLVFLRSAWDSTDWGRIGDGIHDGNLDTARSTLADLGRRLWGADFDRTVTIDDSALQAELRALAVDAASSAVLTRNVEMARQILAIRRDTPTANRFVYASRLRRWDADRAKWKGQQISLREEGRTVENVTRRFLANNRGITGQFVVEPATWAIPVCKFDCIGAVQGGPYDLTDWAALDSFPRHPNCPHHRQLLEATLSGVPDQEMAWLG